MLISVNEAKSNNGKNAKVTRFCLVIRPDSTASDPPYLVVRFVMAERGAVCL